MLERRETPPVEVKCPNCGAQTPFVPANTHRPFCSERCRLIDLGEWFSENRSIPGEDAHDTEHS